MDAGRGGEDRLDCTGGGAGAEPLANVFAEVLASEGHAVYAKRGVWMVEEPGEDADIGGVVCGGDGGRGTAPVCVGVNEGQG